MLSLVSTVIIAKTRKTVFHVERYIKYTLITRPPDKSAELKINFSYFSTKTYVVGTQMNGLDETVLLSTQNPCLK